jgi:ketosteroid isomerase-like protein
VPSSATTARLRLPERAGSATIAVSAHDEGAPVIDDVIARWHRYLQDRDPEVLDGLLADDVVFHSPVVFTPQEGKAVTTRYLQAAAVALAGEGPEGAFRYTKQVLSGDTAVLEFETTVAGKYVNGVDVVRCDDAGRIVEFRVMVRPLQAIQAVHEQMGRRLAAGS